jgi:hypothetical protein
VTNEASVGPVVGFLPTALEPSSFATSASHSKWDAVKNPGQAARSCSKVNEIADDVRVSKLELAATWKSESQQIERKVANGTITDRPHGDVINIGHRTTRDPFKGQGDDQAWGKKELDEARASKLFPQEIKDPVVREYVNRLANNLALNSDLQVPLNTYVVHQELRKDGRPVLGKHGQPEQVANAMALPGGFLIIYAGMILESEIESELAGVISHEMAHCAARHAYRIQSKGRTFGIIQLATTIGLSIFAPGLFQAASYLEYYLKGLLLQGIFRGMGVIVGDGVGLAGPTVTDSRARNHRT